MVRSPWPRGQGDSVCLVQQFLNVAGSQATKHGSSTWDLEGQLVSGMGFLYPFKNHLVLFLVLSSIAVHDSITCIEEDHG